MTLAALFLRVAPDKPAGRIVSLLSRPYRAPVTPPEDPIACTSESEKPVTTIRFLVRSYAIRRRWILLPLFVPVQIDPVRLVLVFCT